MNSLMGGVIVLLQFLSPLPLLLSFLARQEAASGPRSWSMRLLFLAVGGAWLFLIPLLVLGFVGLMVGPAVFVLQALMLIIGLWFLARGPRLNWERPRLDSTSAALIIIFAVGGFVGLIRLLRVPTENYDSLAYHLPLMAHWVQSGTLSAFPGIGGPGWYPGHYELWGTLFFWAPRSDLFVQLPGLFSWGLLGLSIYALAREDRGGSRAASLATAGLVLFLPDLFGRIDAIQPDTAMAALVLAGWWACRRAWKDADPVALLVLGASLSILPGLKYSGLVQVVVLLGTAALSLRFAPILRERRWGWRRPAWLAFILACLLVGGAWYLRNLVVGGGPFVELDREALALGSLSRVFQPGEIADWKVLGEVLWTGFGPGGIVLVLLGLVGVRGRGMALSLGLFLLLQLLLYWQAPYGADNGNHGYRVSNWMIAGLRYGYLIPAALALLAVPALSRLPRILLPPFVLALALFAVQGLEGWNAAWLWVSLGLLLVLTLSPPRVWALALLFLPLAGHLATEGREVQRDRIYGSVHQRLESTGAGRVQVEGRYELARYLGHDWSRQVRVLEGDPTAEWFIRAGEDDRIPKNYERIWAGGTLKNNEVLWRRRPEANR